MASVQLVGGEELNLEQERDRFSRTIWRVPQSLLFRAVTGLALIIILVTAVMFMSIDRFVSAQFSELSQQRILNQISDMQQQLQSEREGLMTLGQLISTDSDLRQSAQYHLFLEGERRPLEMDVARIASAFRFDLFGVWDVTGRPVAVSEGGRLDVVQGLDFSSGSQPRFIWHDERLWTVVGRPIVVNDVLLAWVGIVRQVTAMGQETAMLREVNQSLTETRARVGVYSELIDLPVVTPEGEPMTLELRVVDPVGDALDRTKRVVALTLLGAGVLLMVASIVYLRRVLTPVRELTDAVTLVPSRLEQGDLKPIVVRADGEVAALGVAFNGMIDNLLRLRSLEKELREQEKLSAIGRVAVRVAHDINNPLTVIKNTAHLLKATGRHSSEEIHDLDMILHHSNRCASTVDNLLRFGKPLRLRYEDIEINECMSSFIESVKQRNPKACIRHVSHSKNLTLRGDRQQLEQMMDNLLDNALSANGGQEVLVESGLSEAGMVYMRVTDHGKGFSVDDLAHAFDFFYTQTPGGTGLGLPNARAIARAHGGDVEVTDPRVGEVTVWLAPGEKALKDRV